MITFKLKQGDSIEMLYNDCYNKPGFIASVTLVDIPSVGKPALSFITPILVTTNTIAIEVEGANASNPFEIHHEHHKQVYTTPHVTVSDIPSRVYSKDKPIRIFCDSHDVLCLKDDKNYCDEPVMNDIVHVNDLKKLSDSVVQLTISVVSRDVDLRQQRLN